MKKMSSYSHDSFIVRKIKLPKSIKEQSRPFLFYKKTKKKKSTESSDSDRLNFNGHIVRKARLCTPRVDISIFASEKMIPRGRRFNNTVDIGKTDKFLYRL